MKYVPLCDVCEINPSVDTDISNDSDCSFVPMEYVNEISGTIIKTDTRRVNDVKKGYTFFRNDDVIFAKITPCMENGKCAIGRNLINGIAFGSTEYHVVRAGKNIIPEWIYYFLRQERVRQQAKQWFRGTAGQQRVPSDYLDQLKIFLPPLPEQQRIAAILQKADRLRRLRRSARQLSDTYLQSVFLEMFGDFDTNKKNWDKSTLEDLGTKFFYGTSEKCHESPNGLPVLRIPNILNGEIDLNDLKYAQLTENEARKLSLIPGDLIFVRTNGNPDYVGRCTVFDLKENFLFASYLICGRLNKKLLLPEFVATFLQSKTGRKSMFPFIRTTAGQSNIGIEGLGQIPIILPPLPLQNKFYEVVYKSKSSKKKQAESERQAEHLFQSLLHRAFQGEL